MFARRAFVSQERSHGAVAGHVKAGNRVRGLPNTVPLARSRVPRPSGRDVPSPEAAEAAAGLNFASPGRNRASSAQASGTRPGKACVCRHRGAVRCVSIQTEIPFWRPAAPRLGRAAPAPGRRRGQVGPAGAVSERAPAHSDRPPLPARTARPPRPLAPPAGSRSAPPRGREGRRRRWLRVSAGPALPPRPPRRRAVDWRVACVHTRDRANSAGRPPDLTWCGRQWAQPVARRRQACAGEKDPGSARRGGGARRRVGPGAGRGGGGGGARAAEAAELEALGALSPPRAGARGLALVGSWLRGLLASGECAAPARPRGVVGARGRAERLAPCRGGW